MRVGTLLAALGLGWLLFVSSASAQTDKVQVQWLGQSVFKIITPTGKVIVTDPWLVNNPKTPPEYKNVDALGKVDLVLVSHAHYDHFEDAPELAMKNNAPLYGPAGLDESLLTLGILPANLVPRFNKGGTTVPLPGVNIKITATHAEHSSELDWRPASNHVGGLAQKGDQTLNGGQPIGFIITLENGFKIYHMGDTGLFGDMKFIGDYYKPDLVMIPIGGNFTMDPIDAAYAVREWLKPKFAIPMHYGAHPLGKGTPKEFMDALGSAPVKVFPLNPGEKVDF